MSGVAQPWGHPTPAGTHEPKRICITYKINPRRTAGYRQGYGFLLAKSEQQERCPAARRFSSGVNARGLLRYQSSKRSKEPFILEIKCSYKNCKTNFGFFPDISQGQSNKTHLSITAEAQKSLQTSQSIHHYLMYGVHRTHNPCL